MYVNWGTQNAVAEPLSYGFEQWAVHDFALHRKYFTVIRYN